MLSVNFWNPFFLRQIPSVFPLALDINRDGFSPFARKRAYMYSRKGCLAKVTKSTYRKGSLHLASVLTLESVSVLRNATKADFSDWVKFNRTGSPFSSVKAGESVG